MTSNNEAIQQKIIEIMDKKLHFPREDLVRGNWDEPLTGKIFRFSAVELTYLFLEIEKAFSIRIPESCLHSYGFSTINKIIETIEKCQ